MASLDGLQDLISRALYRIRGSKEESLEDAAASSSSSSNCHRWSSSWQEYVHKRKSSELLHLSKDETTDLVDPLSAIESLHQQWQRDIQLHEQRFAELKDLTARWLFHHYAASTTPRSVSPVVADQPTPPNEASKVQALRRTTTGSIVRPATSAESDSADEVKSEGEAAAVQRAAPQQQQDPKEDLVQLFVDALMEERSVNPGKKSWFAELWPQGQPPSEETPRDRKQSKDTFQQASSSWRGQSPFFLLVLFGLF